MDGPDELYDDVGQLQQQSNSMPMSPPLPSGPPPIIRPPITPTENSGSDSGPQQNGVGHDELVTL